MKCRRRFIPGQNLHNFRDGGNNKDSGAAAFNGSARECASKIILKGMIVKCWSNEEKYTMRISARS